MDLLQKWMKENPERMGVFESIATEQLLNALLMAVDLGERKETLNRSESGSTGG